MRPKNAIQKEVMELSRNLPDITPEQEQEARMSYVKMYAGKRETWCSCCGGRWETENEWNGMKTRDVCPHCGAKGEVKVAANKRKNTETYYFAIVVVREGWQVVRTFLCRRTAEKKTAWMGVEEGGLTYWLTYEVYQVWMKKGHRIIVGRKANPMGCYCDIWHRFSDMEIRRNHYRFTLEGEVAKGVKLLPEIRRNGLKALRRDASCLGQLSVMLNDPKAEILAKGRQWSLFRCIAGNMEGRRMEHFWPSVRVAMRNGYKVKDAGLWLDTLELLEACGKDLRNPRFICPADLRKAHDEAMDMDARRQAKAQLAEVEEEMRKIAADPSQNEEYRERLGRMLDVVIRSHGIEVKPLQSIGEFLKEAQYMRHCVFRLGYYRKPHTLILSAKVNGRKMETVEVNTVTWKIMQSRGRFNRATEYHSRIVDVVNRNMGKFKKLKTIKAC